jgi:hypothetical protein
MSLHATGIVFEYESIHATVLKDLPSHSGLDLTRENLKDNYIEKQSLAFTKRHHSSMSSPSGLEPESQSHDGPALVHVVNKTIFVVVHIQRAVTANQGNFRGDVVADAAE